MINPVLSQTAEKILETALERSLALNNSYYKFLIESKIESPLFPMTGELFTKGEKYFIDTKAIDQIYDGENTFTIIHENQEIIVGNVDILLRPEENMWFNKTKIVDDKYDMDKKKEGEGMKSFMDREISLGRTVD